MHWSQFFLQKKGFLTCQIVVLVLFLSTTFVILVEFWFFYSGPTEVISFFSDDINPIIKNIPKPLNFEGINSIQIEKPLFKPIAKLTSTRKRKFRFMSRQPVIAIFKPKTFKTKNQSKLVTTVQLKTTTRDWDGPGEYGLDVILTGKEEELAQRLFTQEYFNIVASDKISLHRYLPDVRHGGCFDKTYKKLPATSVVIIFYNEPWSTLMRTVHSVYSRSPAHLLHEIILVDDFSNRNDYKEDLYEYTSITFSNKVKILRLKKRSGLIIARLEGAKIATGQVLLFLDSHCEVTNGWLEPLLAPIAANPSVVTCPIVDIIKEQTFAYSTAMTENIGIFLWNLQFGWRVMESRTKGKEPYDPIRTPAMAGGLFAMNREYFWKLGSYDDGMKVWGGENLEMSFRIWMCGGEILIIPCSRVGHVFRDRSPYMTGVTADYHGYNSVRVAEVWMDDYKELFYIYRPDMKSIDFGNITNRISLRKELKCKNFQWYLDNVYPEIFIPNKNVQAWGSITSSKGKCLDTYDPDSRKDSLIKATYCNHQYGQQFQIFSLTSDSKLRTQEFCLDAYGLENENVIMKQCYNRLQQEWDHIKDGPIIHRFSKKCLQQTSEEDAPPILRKCTDKLNQKWRFEHYLD